MPMSIALCNKRTNCVLYLSVIKLLIIYSKRQCMHNTKYYLDIVIFVRIIATSTTFDP